MRFHGGGRRGVGRDVGHLHDLAGEGRGHGRDRRDAHRVSAADAPRIVHARNHQCRTAVGGRADLQQAQGMRDHRRGVHVVHRELLAVACVRVGEAVLAVLDLHQAEVVLGVAVEVHAPARVEREVGRVGDADQEAHPVRIVGTVALGRRQEALRRGVGADDQRDLAFAREDLRARGGERLRARGAGRVRGVHLGALPAQRLREGRAGHVARVAAAHRGGTRDEADVLPAHAGIGDRGARRVHAVFDEVPAPLAPGVHPDAENGDVIAHACLLLRPRVSISRSSFPTRRRCRAYPAPAPFPGRPSGR